MFACLHGITLLLYIISVNLFIIYIHYINYFDWFQCFSCKELDFIENEFDYIIVGSGSAGSIMARRLAEEQNVKVLLLEAGSYGNTMMHIPSFGIMAQGTVFDWGYRTEPQKTACQALDEKRSRWPMGKIFGGTAMLNNMVYLRGHKEDYANWFRNKTDYNYNEDILKYFKKLESSSVIINDLQFSSTLSSAITRGAEILNYPIHDSSCEPKIGFTTPKIMQFNGKRFTTAQILQQRKLKNLTILTNALAIEILFEKSSNIKANGITFEYLGDLYNTRARKGVILSAGVIGSAKLLLQSGIGPRSHLKQMQIPLRVDLPVGDNLQDHVTTGFDLISLNTSLELSIANLLNPITAFNYFTNGSGAWTTVGCENLAFFSLKTSSRPDLQFMILPTGVTSDSGYYLRTLPGLTSTNLWEQYFAHIKSPAITILPIVLHPKSRGFVRLRNRDPHSVPIIEPHYLSDQHDVDLIVEGISIIKRLIDTQPMRELGARLNTVKIPGCVDFEFDTRAYWECYVKQLTITSYHPVGTCRIGGVVDYDFKVLNVDGLYVVDASVLPDLTSGNPVGSVMMLAEKAAELIIEKHVNDNVD